MDAADGAAGLVEMVNGGREPYQWRPHSQDHDLRLEYWAAPTHYAKAPGRGLCRRRT
ncbi:hypothetical protein ACFYXF_40860 [Streptomyces sp. NPDC002680]|uniref:hypothetical protein n=1 Tax=Streptomyces sp. NPDC002680 TaxID=3364659 RepID=UPI0036966656